MDERQLDRLRDLEARLVLHQHKVAALAMEAYELHEAVLAVLNDEFARPLTAPGH